MWPPEALEFLRELEDNNDSAWFRANRSRYDEFLLGPARKLTDQLGHLGEPRFFRPYNNLRFRPGPPLKEHLGVAVAPGGAGAFYFELSLDGLLVGGTPPPGDRSARAVPRGDRRRSARQRLRARARARRGRRPVAQIEPELKRAPRGYPNDHPRRNRLRLKRITVYRRHPLEPWLHKARCDRLIKSELEAAAPLVRWLADKVGPSTRPRERR